MKGMLDQRHRWGAPVRDGARITYTCRSCGLVNAWETVIPDAVLDAWQRYLTQPNIYRPLVLRR
jgi:hypothetical protein